MDHRPSSQFQLKSQVCLKMTHKDGHTCQKRMKRLLADSLCVIQTLFRKNGITFCGTTRLSQVRFGPMDGKDFVNR